MHGETTFAIKGSGLKRREFLKFSVAAGAALGAGALLGHPLVTEVLAQKKREITIAISEEIESLWPNAHIPTSPVPIVLDSIFDNLVYIGSCAQGAPKLAAGLAESWQFKGQEWLIKIRRGVKFHDGEELAAAAVVQSLNEARDKKSRMSGSLVLIDTVEAVDDVTVRLVTKRPLAQQIWGLTWICMISPAALQRYGAEISKHAVGTGLFRQVEWIPGERLVVERVPDWWGFKVAGDLPFNKKNNIERITWRTIKEPVALLTALEAGEIDVAQYVLPHEVDRLRKKKDIQVAEVKHTRTGLLIMNQRIKPFDDVRVRQAINYGVNWDLINKQLLQGKVDNSFGPLLPGQVGYDGTLQPYPYDPTKAKALLAAAGYAQKELELEIFATRSAVELKRVEICQAISQQLKKIGINLKVREVEYGFFLRGYFRNTLPFYIFAYTTYPDPWQYFLQFIYSKGEGRTGYNNPKVDALFEQAMGALDAEARGKLYKEALAIAREDAVLVWRSALNDFRGTRSNLEYAPRCLDNYLRSHLLAMRT
ncbi:MAG: ABC transporter substrate-binding protein [Candidatus Tectomicrobia bacterium]|nr:ABC transporter substrate-binding protein [Candidatus Tectomicrobia bacterium]